MPPIPNHLDNCQCQVARAGTPPNAQFTRIQGIVAGHTVTLDLDPDCRHHGMAARMLVKDPSLMRLGFAIFPVPARAAVPPQ